MITRLTSLFLLMVVLAVPGCDNEEDQLPPELAIYSGTLIGDSEATLNAEFTSLGAMTILGYGFELALNLEMTAGVESRLLTTPPVVGPFAIKVENLASNTLYYVRAFALVETGTIHTEVVSFQTLTDNPTLVTLDATAITSQGAMLQGAVSSMGAEAIADHGFIWSTTANATVSSLGKVSMGALQLPDQFEYTISELTESTTYYFNVYAQAASGTVVYGQEKSFKTAAAPWVRIADFPGDYRSTGIAFSVNGKGYVGLGGTYNGQAFVSYADLWKYDPSENEWTRMGDFPGGALSAAFVFVVGDRVFVGGGVGSGAKSDLREYLPETDEWISRASMASPVYYAATFTIGNKGYVGTGLRDGNLTRELWEYDIETNTWTRKANFAGAVVDTAIGFSIGDFGYIGTGNLSLGQSKEFWRYSSADNTWVKRSDLPSERWLATGFAIGSHGYIGLGNGSPATFVKYDPDNDSWTTIPVYPGGSREGAMAFVIDGKAYVGPGPWPTSKEIWMYDPAK